jgi:DNA-directed RNA polymerase specialized sigma24 family protein
MPMSIAPLSHVVRRIRTQAMRTEEGLSDGELLDSFVKKRDEVAFAALMRRHADMVWGVCSRVLGGHHDAEDAFQATFLVLVRKATTIAPREMVGNWLYGVAHLTALKARANAGRRRSKERQVTLMPERSVSTDPWSDL